jgi:diguanylate cyclase (GGDEF)-like protein
MPLILKTLFFVCLFISYSQRVLADSVDDFIQSIQVATYDCPEDKFIRQVNEYLRSRSVLPEQIIKFRVYKSHWLICVGKNDEAQIMLENLLSDPLMDKNSQSYANVHYQLGFIFDVQEKPEKCDFYRKSEQLAKNKFNDIYLSSQLGLITVCGDVDNVGVKLGRLLSLLKSNLLKGDQKALAHIHNNIGLLYSSIGQRSLAADAYQKSYQIGLNVYEEKHQLNTLISIVTAHSGSGDYDEAKLMIDELGKRNLEVNTPLSNSLFHFAMSRQAYRTNDYESLRKSLRVWDVFLQQTSNQTMQMLYELYVASLCLYDEDKSCVNDFLQKQNASAMSTRLSKHLYYIAFLVKANLFLGNIEAAQLSFNNYSSISLEKLKKQQASARVLGVANLHNEIINLETSLAKSKAHRLQTIVMALITILGLITLGYLFWGKGYLRKLASDPLTVLSNEHSALAKIKKVKVPTETKVNSLALFDVSNFISINVKYGYKAGELALKQVADCLKQVTREQDIVGRVGAEQFIVCLVNIEELVANELFSSVQTVLADLRFRVDNNKRVDVHTNMHVYSSLNSLSDIDNVLAEIRSVLHQTS